MKILSRILAGIFAAGAAVFWLYSPFLGCEGRAGEICADAAIDDFGAMLSFATVLALVLTARVLWPVSQASR